jgi:O-antigen ligase
VRPILGEGWAPHNGFLSVAVGTGLIGLALFGLLFVTVAGPIIRGASGRDPFPAVLLLALVISLLPLGWETHKAAWFILAYLSTVQARALGGRRLRSPRERSGSIAATGAD